MGVEADRPDATGSRYVRGLGDDRDALVSLGDFERFPRWMWRNADVPDFVSWLREYRTRCRPSPLRSGFTAWTCTACICRSGAVIEYLEKVDPEGAVRCRARYACFDHFGDDPQVYGYAVARGEDESCENQVVG